MICFMSDVKIKNIYFSLIVPVFNGAPFVEHFLQIALGQTLEDMEVIMVDDCSTDGWRAMAEEYLNGKAGAEKVKFFSTSVNGGPGAARNVGLLAARGEYVCFLDCDDEFEADFCEQLYLEAKRYGADMICCDAKCGERALKGPDFPAGNISSKIRTKILASFVTRLWTYAFRRQFLIDNNIVFPATRSAEDSAFVTMAWLKAERASHLPKALYEYIVRPDSLSRARMRDRAKQRLASMRYLKAHAPEVEFPVYLALNWAILKKGYLMALKDLLR